MRTERKRKVSLAISAVLTLGLLAGLLAWPSGVAIGLLASITPTDQESYLLGETVTFSGSVDFTSEDPDDATVTIYIDGPQPITQVVPTLAGVYSYSENNLTVTVTREGSFGYGGYGVVTGTINYDVEWAAPVFLSPPPVFKVIPNYEVAFPIPVPAATPTPTPGGPVQLSDTTLAFSVPMLPTPPPAEGAATDLPGVDEAFDIPLLPTPEPSGIAELPATEVAFTVPLPPTPEPDPTAPDDLPTVTEAWTIPVPPTPEPVPGVPTLGTTELAFAIPGLPGYEVPEGITSDGTDFYILVNGPNDWDNDMVLVVDSAGALVDSFFLTTSRAQDITYLNDYLYVADNETWPPKILKVDPVDGTKVSSFDTPEQQNIRGLTNDGTRLWMANEWGWAFYKVTTGGTVLDTIWTDWSNLNAMAIDGSYAFLAQNDKVGAWSTETKGSLTNWFTDIIDIRGMVFLDGVLYLADADTQAVYLSQAPSLEEVTTEAQGMAYDGTNLYIVVNGSPKDKILVVDPDTGALLNSYNAPDNQTDDLAYAGTNLYALSNANRKVKKLNPATGSVISEFNGPGWDNLTALATDGTELYIGQRSGRDIYMRSTSGTDHGSFADWGSPMDGYQSLTYRSLTNELYSSLADKIGRFAIDGNYHESWATTLDDIKAISFVGDVLYMADITTGKMYRASIPSGISVTQDPLGITTDGTDLYILVDASPRDKILKADASTGAILESLDAPCSLCRAITYLDGYLYVGDNAGEGGQRYIRKLDPSDGSEIDSFVAPGGGWDDIGALANNGTDLLAGFANMGEIRKIRASDGYELETYYRDWTDPRSKSSGLAYNGSTDEVYAVDSSIKKVVRLDSEGHYKQSWTLSSLTDMSGLTFIGDVLYIANKGTDTIYKASIPTGAQVTNEPQGLAFDGSTLYVLVDALPADRILKLDPSDGSLLGNIPAPSEWVDAITYLDGYLYVADNSNPAGGGQRSIRKLDPSNGTEIDSFLSPGGGWDDVTGLANDGTDLIVGKRNTRDLYRVRASDGFELQTLSSDWNDPRSQSNGLGCHVFGSETFIFAVDSSIKKIVKLNSEGHYVQLWTLSALTKMKGLTFVGDELYIADADSKKIYKASVPSGVQVTTVPQGLAYDGTSLYILVDALPADQILVVNPGTGELVDNFAAPSSKCDGLTYQDSYLYVADNFDHGGGQRHIVKLDPTDGTEIDRWASPGGGWDDITGLASDGTDLIAGRRNNADLFRIDPSSGTELQGLWPDWNDPRNSTDGLGFYASESQLLAADAKKLVLLDEQGHFVQSWTTTLLDIRGVTFVAETVYIADANSEAIYYALIPGPTVTTSTTPNDMATDGTYLYVVTDGSPVDKVLVLDPSDGSVVDSFNAPGDNADAMTYIDGYLYIAANEWVTGGGFQGKIHKVDPSTGDEVTDDNYPFPNPDWREVGALAPGASLDPTMGNKLIVGPKWGDQIFIVDLTNTSMSQQKSVNPGGMSGVWIDGFDAMAQGSLYAVSGQSFLKIKVTGTDPSVVDVRTLPIDLNIRGMAFIDTTLYLAEANTNRILASTAPGKRPEVTTAGSYEAYIQVQISGGSPTASDPIAFALVKISQVLVAIEEPQDGDSFSTSAATVVATVNDPSINTVFLGLDLPFSQVLSDNVEDPAISNQWNKSGLWRRTDTGKFASPTHSWYYGNVPGMNYMTGGPNSGNLTSWEFDVGSDATLEFDTWYDTEPGFDCDVKLVQVHGTLEVDGEEVTRWWNVAQIVDWIPMAPPPPPPDSAPGFEYKQVPMAKFEFMGGMPQPMFVRIFVDLSDFAGQTVRVRFHFDTVDEYVNDREGWYIDNIVVGTSASSGQAVARGEDDKFTASIELVEGANTIKVKAVNSYTEPPLTGSDEVHVSLDTTAPIVSIDPVESPTNVPSQEIQVHFEEPNWDLFTVSVTNVAGSRIVASIKDRPDGDNLTQTVSLMAGENVITASLTDKAGLTSGDSTTILLDIEPPEIATLDTLYPIGAVSARPGTATRHGDRVILQVDAADADAGVAGIYAIMPGGPGEGPEEVPFLWAGGGQPPEGFETIPQAVRDQWGATADFILPLDIGAGVPPGTFEITVLAKDSAGNESFGTVAASIQGVLSAYNTYLMPEWNLISLPLIPDDSLYSADEQETQIEKLIGDITGLDWVWYYDAATEAWQIFEPGAPSDLEEMETGKGYWVYMDESVFSTSPPLGPGLPDTPIPIKFSYQGSFLEPGQVPPTYNLVRGWNLIGYHGEWSNTAEQYLAGVSYPSRLWAYLLQYNNYIKFEVDQSPDIQLGGFASLNETSTMEPGLGYWLFLGAAGSIAP
jgi:hypothetical protein